MECPKKLQFGRNFIPELLQTFTKHQHAQNTRPLADFLKKEKKIAEHLPPHNNNLS